VVYRCMWNINKISMWVHRDVSELNLSGDVSERNELNLSGDVSERN